MYLEDKNKVILMKMPSFTRVTGVWFYDCNDESDYSIIEMNPVRLKLLASGYVHICFYKFTLNNHKNKLIETHYFNFLFIIHHICIPKILLKTS